MAKTPYVVEVIGYTENGYISEMSDLVADQEDAIWESQEAAEEAAAQWAADAEDPAECLANHVIIRAADAGNGKEMTAEEVIMELLSERLKSEISSVGGIAALIKRRGGSGIKADLYDIGGQWRLEVYRGVANDESTLVASVDISTDNALELLG